MKSYLFIAVPALCLLCACNKGVQFESEEAYLPESYQNGHEMMVLGNRLNDPYSLEYVNAAVNKLYPATKAGREGVQPTDLYVRMLPADQDEFDALDGMGVTMMDHPFDYEILRDGDYYHDPSVEEGDITWQYAVVSPDFKFPPWLEYEVLDSCFISEHAQQTKALEGVDWAAVEREAFVLSGNGAMLEGPTKGGSVAPQGRISIMDDEYSDEPIGVSGVTVVANVFVKVANAVTDEEGYYRMSTTFGTEVRYRLMFKNVKGCAIGLNLILVPASLSALGKGDPSGIDITVDRDSEGKLFSRCVVNNACYDYYEKCREDGEKMDTPPANLRIWIFQNLRQSLPVMLQQGALVDNSMLSDYLGSYLFILKMFLPDIILGLNGRDDYGSIYAETLHQLAHTSHYALVGNTFWDHLLKYDIRTFITSGGTTYGAGTETDHGYCEVAEMWAYYLQTMMYNDRYPDAQLTFGTNYWFCPQILLYLDERGMNRFLLFKAFTSDVVDRDMLYKRLCSLYTDMEDIIEQAFMRYL